MLSRISAKRQSGVFLHLWTMQGTDSTTFDPGDGRSNAISPRGATDSQVINSVQCRCVIVHRVLLNAGPNSKKKRLCDFLTYENFSRLPLSLCELKTRLIDER